METIWYFQQDDKVLVIQGRDEFLAQPATVPDAELLIVWHPDAVRMQLELWGKLGVTSVRSRLEDLEAKGGIFAQAADYYRNSRRHQHPND